MYDSEYDDSFDMIDDPRDPSHPGLITNFHESELLQYARAIQLYEENHPYSKTKYFFHMEAFTGPVYGYALMSDHIALCCKGGSEHDNTKFFRTLDKVRATIKA
jgi:hypothetical protein